MPEPTPTPLTLERDGASQSARCLPSLDPESVGIDERGLEDWLAFSHAYARELVYHNLDGQPGGDWRGLLNPLGLKDEELPAQWQEIASFLAGPDAFDDASVHRRPHFVLFLAFLRLVGLARQRINRLTRQHLDFYYRQFLSLEKQAGRPDRVNILATPAAGVAQALLPAGTWLDAGKDSLGQALSYRTDEDRVVNRAQIQRLYSVFVDKKVTGIRQAREACVVTVADPLLAMFAIVYGEPAAGDPLPAYPAYPRGHALDADFLSHLRDLAGLVGRSLFMDFQEFRKLMGLKNRRKLSASADWQAINGVLAIAAKGSGSGFSIQPADSQDFDANLKKALGNKELDFPSLTNDVSSLEDLYAQSDRQEVRDFIGKSLYLKVDDFTRMMEWKMAIDNDWRIVNALLEAAGQRRLKDPGYRLPENRLPNNTDPASVKLNPASPKFDVNLQDALGVLDFSAFKDVFEVKGLADDLDRFGAALRQVETYFYCPLEDFTQLMDARDREKQADVKKRPASAEWARAYAILAAAFARKVYAGRRLQLDQSRQGKPQKDAMEAMVRLALGEGSLAADELLGRLAVYWPKKIDADNWDIDWLPGPVAAELWPVEAVAKALDTIKAAMVDAKPPVLSGQDWALAVDGLERAWRSREGAAPVAQKEEWLNLYATEDATTAQAVNFGGTPRWRTFGQGRPAPAKGQPPAPALGWAIASPALCLSQGQRDVILTLVFQAGNYDADKIAGLLAVPDKHPAYPFQVEASSEKGWVAPTAVKIESIDYVAAEFPQDRCKALRLTLGFDLSAPAIAALPGAESRWPMIRLLLRSAWQETPGGGNYATPYPLFQGLALARVLIQAKVVGLRDLRLENDEGSLPVGKPFEPFGLSPSAGSGFQFVHPELVCKRLDWLDANLQWMKVPEASLAAHYKNYPANISSNGSFTVKISLVDHRQEIQLAEKAALFDTNMAALAGDTTGKKVESGDARKDHKVTMPDIPASIKASRPGYAYVPEFAPFSLADPASWRRYWRFELNAPDFQHGNYARVSAAKSVEFSAAIAAKYIEVAAAAAAAAAAKAPAAGAVTPSSPALPTPVAADYQVNPPYTPKLKSFSVDYGCSAEIVMNPAKDALPGNLAQGYGKGEERIFYRQAFGGAEIQPEPDTGLYRFLPAYPYEGELYIGLEGVAASQEPQDVAILFQMAEGSANPDLAPQTVEWGYLSGNRWVGLGTGGILADSTHGLVQSGIIKFRLPKAGPNTLLPAELYWLRAAVALHCDSLCDTVALHAQAVSATWVDQGNAPDHLDQPLAAETITKTADSLPGILAIRQPYTSYGGKPGEQTALFDARVSERLRHKQRALTLWDYEHLILERFPDIYKAKCIPAASMEPGELGKVDIVVIPDIRKQLPFNPFEPKATAGQIAEIQAFLAGYVPDLAEIRVKNAYYVPVRVRFAVRFMAGCDPGYHKSLLNEELNQFLSPWAYDQSNDVVIGGSIYANAIVDFLERRPYVDYVAELRLFVNEDGLAFKLVVDAGDAAGYRVRTDRPAGVLVADRQHDIDLIADAHFEDAKFSGIGYMKIELDFIVN